MLLKTNNTMFNRLSKNYPSLVPKNIKLFILSNSHSLKIAREPRIRKYQIVQIDRSPGKMEPDGSMFDYGPGYDCDDCRKAGGRCAFCKMYYVQNECTILKKYVCNLKF